MTDKYETHVRVGDGNHTCHILKQSHIDKLQCEIDKALTADEGDELLVDVSVGRLSKSIGRVKFVVVEEPGSTSIIVLVIIFITLALIAGFVFFLLRKGGFKKRRPPSFQVMYTHNGEQYLPPSSNGKLPLAQRLAHAGGFVSGDGVFVQNVRSRKCMCRALCACLCVSPLHVGTNHEVETTRRNLHFDFECFNAL